MCSRGRVSPFNNGGAWKGLVTDFCVACVCKRIFPPARCGQQLASVFISSTCPAAICPRLTHWVRARIHHSTRLGCVLPAWLPRCGDCACKRCKRNGERQPWPVTLSQLPRLRPKRTEKRFVASLPRPGGAGTLFVSSLWSESTSCRGRGRHHHHHHRHHCRRQSCFVCMCRFARLLRCDTLPISSTGTSFFFHSSLSPLFSSFVYLSTLLASRLSPPPLSLSTTRVSLSFAVPPPSSCATAP